MNFIVQSLLSHTAEPYLAFYLFTTLMEELQLCDNYHKDLPGVTKHCKVIAMLLNNEMPTLYRHLQTNAVEVQMFATDWILTLFAILVPVEVHAFFLTNFLCDGWPYFYRVVLTFLAEIETELLQEEEVGDVLMTLKDLAATPGRQREMASPERVDPTTVLD